MTISEMLKNRADLLGQMRQFLDTHEDKQGKLSAEERPVRGSHHLSEHGDGVRFSDRSHQPCPAY